MQQVTTEKAPKAVGPYSQAIIHGDVVYCSGQIPLDPETNTLVEGDVTEQTRQVFKNISVVLEAAGSSLSQVIKANCYLTNLGDFQKFNEVYDEYLGESKPARAAIGVVALPKGSAVEIEVIAKLTNSSE